MRGSVIGRRQDQKALTGIFLEQLVHDDATVGARLGEFEYYQVKWCAGGQIEPADRGANHPMSV